MDELKGKLKGLFSNNSRTKFKGTGHVLGSAPAKAPSQPPAAQPSRPASHQQPAGRQLSSQASPSTNQAATAYSVQPQASCAQPSSRAAPDPAQSGARSQPSGSQPDTAASTSRLIGSGTGSGTGGPAGALPGVQLSQAAVDTSAESQAEATSHTAAGPGISSPFSSSGGEATPQLQQAAQVLLSNQNAATSTGLLAKILRNVEAHPSEPRYRRLRLGNEKIHEAVVETDGGLELLQACGFVVAFQEVDGTGQTEGFAVLPEDADLAPVSAALRLLCPLGMTSAGSSESLASDVSPARSATSPSQAASPATATSSPPQTSSANPSQPPAAATSSGHQQPMQPAPARRRNTKVLLPTETGARMDDWVFERSPAELKAAFMNALKRREQSQVLMTKAYREKLESGNKDTHSMTYAIIRVRLPEGIILQGEFNAGELVISIFEWVASSLRVQGSVFDLIQPDRKPLPSTGSVRSARLMPNTLLNLRFEGRQPTQNGLPMPALTDELLRQAQPAS